MSTHTPGPWTLHQPGSMRACDGQHDSADGCRTIVEAEIIGIPRAEAEANARLIAAAPKLLQLVREALQHFTDDQDPDNDHSHLIDLRDWVESTYAVIEKVEDANG